MVADSVRLTDDLVDERDAADPAIRSSDRAEIPARTEVHVRPSADARRAG